MNYTDFELIFKDRIWLREFKEEFKELDSEIFEKITQQIQVFEHLKILVLMGLNNEARRISRGFEFDAGCCAWRLGSFYRIKPTRDEQTEFEKLLLQVKHVLSEPQKISDLIINDLIAWYLAFIEPDEIFGYYELNKSIFKKSFPYIILLERIIGIDIKLVPKIFRDLNELSNLTTFEEVLVNNKIAVHFQLKGDQKQALNYFEVAAEKAEEIQDYFDLSKISFNQGSSSFLVGDYELSLYYYQKAETTYKMLQDNKGLGKCYNSLSSVYSALGEYIIAEKYIVLAKQIFDRAVDEKMSSGLIYKHASILHVQGSYKNALNLLQSFTSKEDSILSFEVGLLKLYVQFETDGTYDSSETNSLLLMANKINYQLGIGNVMFFWSKMLILKGIVSDGIKKLDESYAIFQRINYIRGIIKSLNLYAFVEMIKGNIQGAETYCISSSTQAKNAKLYLEEIESNISLANIFFLKDEKHKAVNLIENVLLSLEMKHMKNNHYLRALASKCTFEILINFQADHSQNILKNSLIEFINLSKNRGLYFQHHSQLLEAQEFMLNQDFQNVISISKEVLSQTQNFEIKFIAQKTYIKGLIGLLQQNKQVNSFPSEKISRTIKNELKKIHNNLLKKDFQIKLIEFELLELSYNFVIGQYSQAPTMIKSLTDKITRLKLFYFLSELEKFELKDLTTSNNFSKPELEIEMLIK